ncbi:hypothetical protein ACHAPJ_006589 [Fusarium lateritium]
MSSTTTAAASTPGSEDKGSAPTDVAEFLLGKDPEKVHLEEIGAGDQDEPVEVVDPKESNFSTQAPKPHQPSQMFLGAARAWFQRIVSPSTANDWNDQNIEAFQFDITSHCYGNPEKSVVKLEMDAKQLKTVLSKLNSHRRWRRSPELFEHFRTEDDVSIIPDAWRSLVRPGVTLRMVMWHAPIPPMGHHAPPPHWAAGIGPKVVQVDPEKKKVYHEMVELLGFEDAWSPDKETMKPGLRNLLSLWTNAVDPHAEDCSDSDSSASVWSSSSSSSTSSWEIAD